MRREKDYDTRIEGSTDENLVVVDAGNNRLGVGTATPSVKLDVNGDVNMQDLTVNGDANMYQDVTVSEGFVAEKGILVNRNEGDNDSKLSGTSDENLTYWDAGNDRVGIGTDTPSVKLDVNGDGIYEEGLTINEGGGDNDTRIEGDTDANLFYVDAGNDRVGIGNEHTWSITRRRWRPACGRGFDRRHLCYR
jgi:hypothetical protein